MSFISSISHLSSRKTMPLLQNGRRLLRSELQIGHSADHIRSRLRRRKAVKFAAKQGFEGIGMHLTRTYSVCAGTKSGYKPWWLNDQSQCAKVNLIGTLVSPISENFCLD